MRRHLSAIALGLVAFLGVTTFNLTSATGASYSMTLSVRQTPSVNEPLVTLYGQVKPARKAQKVSIQVQIAKKWQSTSLATKTTSSGTWKIEAVATALSARVNYRAMTIVGSKKIYSATRAIKIVQRPEMSNPDPVSLINISGPGGRIHGMDISRWQHPGNAPIDFVKMYAAGVRFVMIKAADAHDKADAEALKYLVMDHDAAQAAGIYTGFYYYSYLPDSTDDAVIIADAQAQAQRAVWRLASMGGYTSRDLSFALDLENNCVRTSSSGTCTKYAARAAVTLWAETWLASVREKTNRLPIIYSYPQFLENAMTRSGDLLQYPLWIAHYSLNPFDPLAQPGQKTAGCFVTPWTTANCSSLWAVWQYTSCGIANKYGVPGTRVDLNVFRGTPSAFLDLASGTWIPEVADLMPTQEPTATLVNAITQSTSAKPVTFAVDVNRPTGSPVVTGTVKFVVDKVNPIPVKIVQTAVRSSSGRWILTVKGIPAGMWTGQVVFVDVSGTHATSGSPVTLTISQGPTPTPTPTPTGTPTPKPTPTKKPAVDSCKYQIKN